MAKRNLPSLKSLQAFEAAARHLSFRVAAEELSLTQSAISHQVARLEADLGVRLFERSAHGVRLSVAGSRYLERVSGALAAIADQDWIAKCRAHNREWRSWLAGEVAQMGNAGLRAIPSAGNFIMIEFPEAGPVSAEGANAALMAAGFLVRWLPGQGLGRCLRISIGTEAETRGVAAALRAYVEGAA